MCRATNASIVPLLLLFLAACPAPGEGAKAQSGYRTAQPVIDALAAFHTRTGRYPGRLEELVPRDLAALPAGGGDPAGVRGWRYQPRAPDGYDLSFSYNGPGVNRCQYTPEQGWRCSGYY